MASLSFIVGIIGNLISILVYASPIKTFRKIVKKKSTQNYKAVPYITTLISTNLWAFYGFLKPAGFLLITVNGVGSVFQLVYVTLFIIYAPKDQKIKTAKLVALLNVGFVGAVVAVSMFAMHGRGLRLTFVGILCVAITIIMYASPLSAVGKVIKTNSVEYMPFLLSFFLFINGGVWSIYAILVKDLYIGIPSVIGFILGSAQLILYTIYKMKSSAPTKSTEDRKEGPGDIVKKANVREMHSCDDEEPKLKNGTLGKGNSLPKPRVLRERSFQKIVKTFSLGPYDLQHYSNKFYLKIDIEKGNLDPKP